MARYWFGQVPLAFVKDGAGHTKEHPVVVVGSDEDCGSRGPLQFVLISNKIQDPCPNFHIRVHDSFKTSPMTGLYQPCVVKCNWCQEVEPRRIISVMGSMPDQQLDTIIDKINELIDDDCFVGWVDHECGRGLPYL